jgi:hypothetical protein
MPLGRTVGVDSAEEGIVSGLGEISKNNESSLGLIYTQVIKPKVGAVCEPPLSAICPCNLKLYMLK